MTIPAQPVSVAAALDRILENQNIGITRQMQIASRLHTMANFMQSYEQRILDVRDDIKTVMRTVETMHIENKVTLATLQQQVNELNECKALLESIQLEGKLVDKFRDYMRAGREVANTPTPEPENDSNEPNSPT